jgi:hypothetical protein
MKHEEAATGSDYLGIRIPLEMKRKLEQEARERNITLSDLVKEKIIIASASTATIFLNFGGAKMPVAELERGVVTIEKTTVST